jgi:hypothetical protein
MNTLHPFRLTVCILAGSLILFLTGCLGSPPVQVHEQYGLGGREADYPEEKKPAAEPADAPQKSGESQEPAAAREEKTPPVEKKSASYSQDQIEEMFQYIPLTDPVSPREVSVGTYYLAPPARIEEGWSLNIYTRKAGDDGLFRGRYKEPGLPQNYLPVLKDGVHSIQALTYDLLNTGYEFGDTVEYYFELRVRETGQTFVIPRGGTLTYQIKTVPKSMEGIFAVEPVEAVAAGVVYDAWAVSRYDLEDFPLEDVTMVIHHREAGSTVYQSMEAPRVSKGFIVAIPTTGYRANTTVEFYCEFFRQNAPIGTYGSPEEPRSFMVMPR